MDIGHWQYDSDFNPDDWFGFCYLITNLKDGRKYVGMKQFTHKRTLPPLKGRKRKRTKYVDSGWRSYTGSCKELNASIEESGIDNFLFEMISLHDDKTTLRYNEARQIMIADAVYSDEYYNNNVRIRITNNVNSSKT